MKSVLAGGVGIVTLLGSAAQAATRPDPTGVWLRDDSNARVHIARCGQNFCATNLWIGDTSGGGRLAIFSS
jgi:uncharacterized protein (DUF2147 family)